MWRMILNEWYALGRSRLLLSLSLVFLAILLGSVWLGKWQAEERKNHYLSAQKELRHQWENAKPMHPHGAVHYGTYVFKPTTLLSGLDAGVIGVTGNVLRVEGHVQNEVVHSAAAQMEAASKFGQLNGSLILQYIVPLLLLFLAFQAVSSEKRSGRLRLLIAQGANLSTLVWAKTLSVWLYSLFLLLITIGSFALFNRASFTSEIATRTGLLFLSYALYYFVISGLTVFFSARWQQSTAALTSMLGIWIVWTIFLPNILMSSIENWHELPSRNAFIAAMREDRSKGIDGHNPKDERSKALERETLEKYGVDSLSQLPINFDGLRMQADEEYGNQVWDKHFGALSNNLTAQKSSYQLAGLLTPFISLQNASMGFAGSDNLHHQDFLLQAEHYRRELIETLNNEHTFGGSTKTGDWTHELDQDFFQSVPDYVYRPLSTASVFPAYITDLLMLLSWTLFVGLLLFLGIKNMPII